MMMLKMKKKKKKFGRIPLFVFKLKRCNLSSSYTRNIKKKGWAKIIPSTQKLEKWVFFQNR